MNDDNEMYYGATPVRRDPDIKSHVPINVDLDVTNSGYHLTPVGTSIPELQRSINDWAVSKQWRGPDAVFRPATVDCALFGTEVAEAVEALRVNADPKYKWYSYSVTIEGIKFEGLTKEQLGIILGSENEEEIDASIEELGLHAKPEGFASELADIVIRILETAEENGIELLDELLEKMEYNGVREIRHGGKLI